LEKCHGANSPPIEKSPISSHFKHVKNMLKKINLTAGILLRTYFINPTPLSLNGIKATSLFLFHVYPLPIFVNASLWEMSGVERHYFVDTIPWKIYDRPLCFFLKNIGSQCLALNLWRKWFRERKVSQLSLRGRCVMAHHTSSMEDLCAPYNLVSHG
jgi:hypothetical protein